MLRFKQFLLEGIVDQINYAKETRKEFAKKFDPKRGRSYIYQPDNPSGSQFLQVKPDMTTTLGDFMQLSDKDGKIGTAIRIYTNNPSNVFKQGSEEWATMAHELGHSYQEKKITEKNPNRPFEQSARYSKVETQPDLPGELSDKVRSSLSYNTDIEKEANARAVAAGEEAQLSQNIGARRRISFDPKIADFELEYEKSGGILNPPELRNIEARARSAGRDALNSTLKYERASTDYKKRDIFNLKNLKDREKAIRELENAQKYVEKRAGAAVVANQQNAEGSMRDEYSRLVTSPMRERHGRVQNTQAQVNQALLPSKSGMIGSPNTNLTTDMAINMMGLLTPPSSKDRMQIEKDVNTDVGLGFDLEGGELVASPEGFEAVRRRQKQGVKFPTAFPDNLYK